MADLEIERLVRRERYYRDTEQWEKWRACFHPDDAKTSINISWFNGRIDDWVKQSIQLSSVGVAPRHTLSPLLVDVNGEKAVAITACDITARFPYSEGEYDLVTKCRLVSRCLVVGGVWKLVSLECIYLQDSILPIVPGQPPATFDLASISSPRSSYKCLIWQIERRGRQARRDLPGVDDPSSVAKVMDGAATWLAEDK